MSFVGPNWYPVAHRKNMVLLLRGHKSNQETMRIWTRSFSENESLVALVTGRILRFRCHLRSSFGSLAAPLVTGQIQYHIGSSFNQNLLFRDHLRSSFCSLVALVTDRYYIVSSSHHNLLFRDHLRSSFSNLLALVTG
jgi:hypothetical protein